MKKISRLQALETIGGLTVALSIIGLWLDLSYLVYGALALLTAGLFVSPFARGLTFLLRKISRWVGMALSKIILAIIFYLLLTPIALVLRIFKHDPLMLKKQAKESYYTATNKTYSPEDFEKIW